jgi:predicted lipoprotein with Yx(FWY)xxD motif
MSIKSAVVAALAVALVATGSALAAHRTVQSGAVVELHKTKLGEVLANSKGLTLYMYTPDGHNKSRCTGSCASIWPPLTTSGKPRAAMGAKQSLLGTTRRSNGKLQVTYAGHPLYHYSGDAKAGQTAGEGYGGIWFAISASGRKVATSTSGTGTTTTGGGYGY